MVESRSAPRSSKPLWQRESVARWVRLPSTPATFLSPHQGNGVEVEGLVLSEDFDEFSRIVGDVTAP